MHNKNLFIYERELLSNQIFYCMSNLLHPDNTSINK